MTTASIDIETLDKLFDNQKKLDDVFSSIFDDDDYLQSSSASFNDHTPGKKGQKNSQDTYSNEDYSYNADDLAFVQEKRNIIYVILPVAAEIAAIYYALMYFS
ncbi:MAG: hypothetical protein ACKE51_02970 [Methylococcaceae bacterium]